ncbi:uncharacterized protein LOC142585904 [Dermacentor variabilis]|uniref:uncharacterized protein LOC142585904 n=1 Tax=Dermacentor variabilis TaxID=34621 RepID=UPI003F5C8815
MSFRDSPPVHSAPASQPLASSCRRNLHCPPCSTSTAISHNGFSSALPCPRRVTFSACRSAIRRLCTQLQPHSHASCPDKLRDLYCPPCSMPTALCNPRIHIRCQPRSVSPA